MAKAYATEGALRVTHLAIQLHGSYGLAKEFPLERWARDARMLTDLYVQLRYSPRLPDMRMRKQAIQTWQQLRPKLWRVWLWQTLRRKK